MEKRKQQFVPGTVVVQRGFSSGTFDAVFENLLDDDWCVRGLPDGGSDLERLLDDLLDELHARTYIYVVSTVALIVYGIHSPVGRPDIVIVRRWRPAECGFGLFERGARFPSLRESIHTRESFQSKLGLTDAQMDGLLSIGLFLRFDAKRHEGEEPAKVYSGPLIPADVFLSRLGKRVDAVLKTRVATREMNLAALFEDASKNITIVSRGNDSMTQKAFYAASEHCPVPEQALTMEVLRKLQSAFGAAKVTYWEASHHVTRFVAVTDGADGDAFRPGVEFRMSQTGNNAPLLRSVIVVWGRDGIIPQGGASASLDGHVRATAEKLVELYAKAKEKAKPLYLGAVDELEGVPIRDARRTLGSIMAKGAVDLEKSNGSEATATGIRRSIHIGLWKAILGEGREDPEDGASRAPKTMAEMYRAIFAYYIALTPTLSYAQEEKLRIWLGKLMPWSRGRR